MVLVDKKSDQNIAIANSYREAASGANDHKTRGGCGCD